MQTESERKEPAILWSHNENKHPFWLASIMLIGVDVWWDVRWKLNTRQFSYPLAGYIWNTVEQCVTHKALVVEIDPSPTDKIIEEVLASWNSAKLHVNRDSPLHLYQKDRTKTCTLLRLSNLTLLKKYGELDQILLFKEKRPIGGGPQGVAIIENPNFF